MVRTVFYIKTEQSTFRATLALQHPNKMDKQKGSLGESLGNIPEGVERFFLKMVEKNGHYPSTKMLRAFCQKNGHYVTKKALEQLQRRYANLAMLSNRKRKPRAHSTLAIPRYGHVFVDLFFFRPEWKGYNNNIASFVLGVEASTKQLAVFTMRGKSSEHWKEGLKKLITESVFDIVKTLVVDQEPSLVSKTFRTRLFNDHGTQIMFLKRRDKSYLSEVMGRWVKTALAKSCQARKNSGDKNYRRWIDALPGIVKAFNDKPCGKFTSYKRKDIRVSNFDSFLDEKMGSGKESDYTLKLNTRTYDVDKLGIKKMQKLFQYPLGAHVLASKRSLANADKSNESTFFKPSVTGGYSEVIFTVVQRVLTATKEPELMVPGNRIEHFSAWRQMRVN